MPTDRFVELCHGVLEHHILLERPVFALHLAAQHAGVGFHLRSKKNGTESSKKAGVTTYQVPGSGYTRYGRCSTASSRHHNIAVTQYMVVAIRPSAEQPKTRQQQKLDVTTLRLHPTRQVCCNSLLFSTTAKRQRWDTPSPQEHLPSQNRWALAASDSDC